MQDRYELFFFTIQPSQERLRRALNLLDWTKCGRQIRACLNRFDTTIMDVLEQKHLILTADFRFALLSLEWEKGSELKIEIPAGFHVKRLNPDEAEFINDNWAYRHPGSEFYIRRLIEWNVNAGIYHTKSGNLCGWCLRCGFALLQISLDRLWISFVLLSSDSSPAPWPCCRLWRHGRDGDLVQS